ncbi:hypothetical protein [Streptomyces hirsutus]|uniref:hypothetical protein n=1 Tax=Streptomyces hirsutus TaxID=35620 RepID=UPI0036C5DF5C
MTAPPQALGRFAQTAHPQSGRLYARVRVGGAGEVHRLVQDPLVAGEEPKRPLSELVEAVVDEQSAQAHVELVVDGDLFPAGLRHRAGHRPRPAACGHHAVGDGLGCHGLVHDRQQRILGHP